MHSAPTIKVAVLMPPALQLALAQLARRRKTNVSALCRAAIRNEIERAAREAGADQPHANIEQVSA